MQASVKRRSYYLSYTGERDYMHPANMLQVRLEAMHTQSVMISMFYYHYINLPLYHYD